MRLALAVTVACCLSLPLPVSAASQKEACELNTQIMTRIVELRDAKTRKKKTIKILTSEEEGFGEDSRFLVEAMAEWVYDQPRDDTQKFDPEAFKKACMNV